MNQVKWIYFLLAVIGALSIASFGIAVAERSILIAIGCFLGLTASFTIAKLLRSKLN